MNDGGYMAVSPHSSDIIFCTGNVYDAAYFVGVSHTSDGGASWEHDTLALGTRGWAVAFDPVDPNRVYVGGDSAYSYPCLLITTDLGATWTQSRTGLTGAVNALLTVPGSGQLVYAGTNNGAFKSTDAGATWAATSVTSQVKTLVLDPAHPATLFAGTYGNGVYVTPDAGATWNQMNAGLACTRVLSLSLRPGTENTLFAGTEGGAVFRTSLPTGVSGPTASDIRNSPLVITPNPCYSAATVRFSSRLAPNSLLSLYDASGRFLCSFPLRTSSFVLHTSDLTAGTYFVRLTSGRSVHTARLTVLD
jgi:hypothetical protein